jgi:hypothetical protein
MVIVYANGTEGRVFEPRLGVRITYRNYVMNCSVVRCNLVCIVNACIEWNNRQLKSHHRIKMDRCDYIERKKYFGSNFITTKVRTIYLVRNAGIVLHGFGK